MLSLTFFHVLLRYISPREGTETTTKCSLVYVYDIEIYKSPRGDGNTSYVSPNLIIFVTLRYISPREGTETILRKSKSVPAIEIYKPPRGDGNLITPIPCIFILFIEIYKSPRGDGNFNSYLTHLLNELRYISPREGTETFFMRFSRPRNI